MVTNLAMRRAQRGGVQGFTLLELMVVVAILGILAAIVVPKFLFAVDESTIAAAKTQIGIFGTTLTAYRLNFHKFPNSLDDLITNGKQNYLGVSEVPKDPWGNAYNYTAPGADGRDYDIISYGADGAKGGTGINADIESWNLQKSSSPSSS